MAQNSFEIVESEIVNLDNSIELTNLQLKTSPIHIQKAKNIQFEKNNFIATKFGGKLLFTFTNNNWVSKANILFTINCDKPINISREQSLEDSYRVIKAIMYNTRMLLNYSIEKINENQYQIKNIHKKAYLSIDIPINTQIEWNFQVENNSNLDYSLEYIVDPLQWYHKLQQKKETIIVKSNKKIVLTELLTFFKIKKIQTNLSYKIKKINRKI